MSRSKGTPVSLSSVTEKAKGLLQARRYRDVERLYRPLAETGHPTVLNNLVHVLMLQARYGEAGVLLKKARQLHPNDARFTGWLARLHLLHDRYLEGFQLNERRSVFLAVGGPFAPPNLPYPKWDGGPVKRLLILAEQGAGDQIMMARYVPLLKARGIEVILQSLPSLVRLFEPLDVQVIPADVDVAVPEADAWALSFSLPYYFGSTLETLPSAPYLPSTTGGLGTGLVTRGNPEHRDDWNRSIPPAIEATLASRSDVRSLDPAVTGAKDFEDTARIIDKLERVVTVDTSVAHLAGAMGKPVFVLLPFNPDWRWGLGRSHSPWYPSARLLRQPRPGDWESVVKDLQALL